MTDTAERSADPPEAPERSGRRGHPGLTLIAVALGVMMVALDGTVVSVANPTIEKDLHSSLQNLQWVTNGYLLSLAVLLIIGESSATATDGG